MIDTLASLIIGLSSAGPLEKFYLHALSWIQENKGYQCHICQVRTKHLMEVKGCDDYGKLRHKGIGGADVYTCLGNFYHPMAHAWFQWFFVFQSSGVLPYQGSLAEQPSKIIEVFEICQSLEAKRQERENNGRKHS